MSNFGLNSSGIIILTIKYFKFTDHLYFSVWMHLKNINNTKVIPPAKKQAALRRFKVMGGNNEFSVY